MGSLGLKFFCATTPHFFKIILEDTSKDYKLTIPRKFLLKYGENLSDMVRLKLPSGSEWQVELTRCNGRAWFERGWPQFSRFCSLEYGRFLVFKYEGNSQFEVFIFDKSATEIDYPLTIAKTEEVDEDDLSIESLEDSTPGPKRRKNSSLLYPACKKMRTSLSGNLDAAKEFYSENPFFLVTLGLLHKEKSNVSLPASFDQSFIKEAKQTVKLQVKNRSWPVKLCRYRLNAAKFSGGWAAFAKEHQLVEGDICIFELTDINEIVMKVHIFRCQLKS